MNSSLSPPKLTPSILILPFGQFQGAYIQMVSTRFVYSWKTTCLWTSTLAYVQALDGSSIPRSCIVQLSRYVCLGIQWWNSWEILEHVKEKINLFINLPIILCRKWCLFVRKHMSLKAAWPRLNHHTKTPRVTLNVGPCIETNSKEKRQLHRFADAQPEKPIILRMPQKRMRLMRDTSRSRAISIAQSPQHPRPGADSRQLSRQCSVDHCQL